MADLLNWYCNLFGYQSCNVLSTFEAIVLAGLGFIICSVGLGILVGATEVLQTLSGNRN